MKKFRVISIMALSLCLSAVAFGAAACSDSEDSDGTTYITTAYAREAGSGTRSAFDELVVNSDGDSLANVATFSDAVLTSSSTGAVITAVAQSTTTLGYVSLGNALENSETIKAVNLNGVEATNDNVSSGEYELSRPFILVYLTEQGLSDLEQNFIDYCESEAGQEIIEEYDFIPAAEEVVEYTAYEGTDTTLKLGGSTSMSDVMSAMAKAYMVENPSVTVTVEGGGSGTGISGAGTDFNLGLASRDLKSGEEEETYTSIKIADDGIAVIVSVNCALTNVTFDQLYDIYANGTKIECV